MGQHDAVLIQEAHGTAGAYRSWRAPIGCKSWWSAGASYGCAGVGIVVKQSVLPLFDAEPVWDVIWPGRAARLMLRGKLGALDLWTVYFPTGVEVTEADFYGVHPAARQQCTSFTALRDHLRVRIARALTPRDNALTVLCGD